MSCCGNGRRILTAEPQSRRAILLQFELIARCTVPRCFSTPATAGLPWSGQERGPYTSSTVVDREWL